MKYLTFSLFIIACSGSHAQSLDSLKQRILKLEINQQQIQLNLRKSHKEFGSGALIMLAGAVMSAVYAHGRAQDAGYEKPVILYAGMGLVFVGGAIMVDSHKYIGRAGERLK